MLLLDRIRRDRGSGSDFVDFKTGTGGIIEGEFLVHALQMKAEVWAPSWSEALEKLFAFPRGHDSFRVQEVLRPCAAIR